MKKKPKKKVVEEEQPKNEPVLDENGEPIE